MANGFQGAPAVDFYSMLSGLGDTIQKNQAARTANDIAAARAGAVSKFSQLDPNSPDYGKSVQALSATLHPSDQDGQFKFIGLAHQAQTDARQAKRDATSDQHWAITDGRAANADRRAAAAEGRNASDWENTPDQYVPNPAAATDPSQPKFIDQYAASRAAAEADAEKKNPTLSTQVVYGTDTDPASPTYGKPIPMQASKRGDMVRSKMPDGVSLSNADPNARKTLATRYLDTGDEGLIQRNRFGPGQIGQQEYDATMAEIEAQRGARGMRPDEITSNKIDTRAKAAAASAGARVRATREANLNMILEVADAAVPAALEASAKVPRGKLVPLNQLIQKGQVMTSDPDLNNFGIANLQLAEGWARAMNPTGVMRESDRDKALEKLSVSLQNGTYESAVRQVQTQIKRERDAIATGGHTAGYDHRAINGGRPIKVSSPDDAASYPSGTKILIPNGSGGFAPGIVP